MSVGKVFKFYRTFALYNKEDFTPEEQQAFAEGVEHALKGGSLLDCPYSSVLQFELMLAWDTGVSIVRREKRIKETKNPLTPR